jgi:hypothetical protein
VNYLDELIIGKGGLSTDYKSHTIILLYIYLSIRTVTNMDILAGRGDERPLSGSYARNEKEQKGFDIFLRDPLEVL